MPQDPELAEATPPCKLEQSSLQRTIWASRDGAEFQYDESNLSAEAAVPLSLSLPLKKDSYSRSVMQSCFEGLLPEGPARTDLAQQIGIREKDPFALLAECGRERKERLVLREA